MTATEDAWRSFCQRLAAVGERILADDFPTAERDRAEGFRHLANQVACWLTHAIGHTDPRHPAFFRSSDPVYQWGGPNADQVARRARIAGDGTYRISGTMGSCEDFVLQVKRGAVQSGGADVALEMAASDLGIGPGDDFAIVLGPEQLGPDATFVHVRDYYFDWQAREPATFVIECLDAQGTPADPVTPERVAAMLADAAHEIEHSMVFWRDYQARMRAGAEVNRFGAPAPAPRGVQDIIYSHAFVALGDSDALLVDFDAAGARWWDVQAYNRAWYEALDFRTRQTSLNHRQAETGGGDVRIVVAGGDPGVRNWLDTEGRDEVLVTIRWFRPTSTPVVSTVVTGLADGAGPVDAAARREQIKRREAHAAWRYRT